MKKQTVKKALAALLCILMVCALSACSIPHFHIGKHGDEPQTTAAAQPEPQPEPQTPGTQPTPAPSPGVSQLPEYYHYDIQPFYDDCETMLNSFKSGDTDTAFQYYQSLSDALLDLDELQSVVYVKYSENVNDEYYSDEYKYMNETTVSAADRFFSYCHQMITK